MGALEGFGSHAPGTPAEWQAGSHQNRGRIATSILVPVAWLCFTLLSVGFWAEGLTLFQSFVVVLVSVILLGGALGLAWTWWAPIRP